MEMLRRLQPILTSITLEVLRRSSREYHYNCARYQSQVFLNKFGTDILRISQNCFKTGIRVLKEACLESIGYSVVRPFGNPEDIKIDFAPSRQRRS